MVFKYATLITFFLFLSCNFNNNSSSSKYDNDTIVNDTVLKYYKNGKLKSKGVIKDNEKIGWWTYYDTLGRKSDKIEYLQINDSIYINQKIIFDKNLNIDYNKSDFFNVIIEDTLNLGKNIGVVKYYSSQKEFDLQNVFVIIDNEYEKGVVKKDSFIESPNKSRFGFFGLTSGNKTIKGTILEQLAFKNQINKDSFELKIVNIKKYFEKEVYVKDTIN